MNTLALIACAIGAIGGVILWCGIRLGMMMHKVGGAANEDSGEGGRQ